MKKQIDLSPERRYFSSISLKGANQAIIDGPRKCLEILALADENGLIQANDRYQVVYRPKKGGPVLVGPQQVEAIHYGPIKNADFGYSPRDRGTVATLTFRQYKQLSDPK